MELVGASAMPLLIGVTSCCDTKTTEVMSTRLHPCADAVEAAAVGGTNNVAASYGLELEDEDDAAAAVCTSVFGSILLFCPGQPEELHGSTEQQPLKPFEVHV